MMNKARQTAGPAAIISAVVVLVLALGAGGFYVFNGGWQTAGQQDAKYKHDVLPIIAAKHGDTEALEQENKLRKEQGQPALEMPKDRHEKAEDQRAKLQALQDKINPTANGN